MERQIKQNCQTCLTSPTSPTNKRIINKELRAGMGEGLVEAGRKNENVVALSADVKGSVKMG